MSSFLSPSSLGDAVLASAMGEFNNVWVSFIHCTVSSNSFLRCVSLTSRPFNYKHNFLISFEIRQKIFVQQIQAPYQGKPLGNLRSQSVPPFIKFLHLFLDLFYRNRILVDIFSDFLGCIIEILERRLLTGHLHFKFLGRMTG